MAKAVDVRVVHAVQFGGTMVDSLGLRQKAELLEVDHGVLATLKGESTLVPWANIRQVRYEAAKKPA